MTQKYQVLLEILRKYGRAAIAFSGGVDSTLLMYAGVQALGDNVCAVTAKAEAVPEREIREASAFCKEYHIRHKIVEVNQMDIPGFAENSENRCYLCKKVLFTRLIETAGQMGCSIIAEGSNADDDSDFRPGMRAIKELGVVSPLREAGMTKAEIRALCREFGLPVSSKPSFACLATRIPYGDRITAKKLTMADLSEQYLRDIGFTQVRVRVHGAMARIEVLPEETGRLAEDPLRKRVNDRLREYGFSYVTLDLAGYRTGSMNETLDDSVMRNLMLQNDSI